MRKVLVVGADGQLAFDLIRILEGKFKIIRATRENFDVSDYSATTRFIKKIQPDIVINTAAYHKTEECEINPEKSFAVNAIGAFNVAKSAAISGAKIIYISTDYVFGGGKKYFKENDVPSPLNIYGASKLAGEILTKIANPAHYIIRTSWLFGIHQSSKGYNFVSLMLQKAKKAEIIRVAKNQFGSPTYTYDLALKIKEVINRAAPSGIYHITNSGSCSRYQFAKKIFELAGVNIKLRAVKLSELSLIINRPRRSILKSKNLKRIGLKNLRSWQKALFDYLRIAIVNT